MKGIWLRVIHPNEYGEIDIKESQFDPDYEQVLVNPKHIAMLKKADAKVVTSSFMFADVAWPTEVVMANGNSFHCSLDLDDLSKRLFHWESEWPTSPERK